VQTPTIPIALCTYIGGANGGGTGIGNNGGGGGGRTADSCTLKDPCGGPGSTTLAAGADQALIGGITKKLSKDIDALSAKLKGEARMRVTLNCVDNLTFSERRLNDVSMF